jgi:hypothetical protein
MRRNKEHTGHSHSGFLPWLTTWIFIRLSVVTSIHLHQVHSASDSSSFRLTVLQVHSAFQFSSKGISKTKRSSPLRRESTRLAASDAMNNLPPRGTDVLRVATNIGRRLENCNGLSQWRSGGAICDKVAGRAQT